jgi:hypothetical protein
MYELFLYWIFSPEILGEARASLASHVEPPLALSDESLKRGPRV